MRAFIRILRRHVGLGRRLTLLLALALLLTGNTVDATLLAQPEQPLQIDFDWISTVPQEVRHAVAGALAEQRSLVLDARLTVTAFRAADDWARLILVPTAVVESDWEAGLNQTAIVQVFLHRENDQWTAWLREAQDFKSVQAQIPTTLYDFSAPESHGYLFPWTGGFLWTVGSLGWHGSSGNAIDFSPQLAGDDVVLAADGGTVTEICNDGEQATYQVFHHDAETTRYLHLAANSIDPSIDGQSIPRGWWLGNLYDGVAGAGPCTINGNPALCQFNTPCGLGSGPHLHFEISDMTATVNGTPISVVGNTPGSIWLSSNAPVYPCSPPNSGDWTVSADCIMTGVDSAPANVVVQNGAVLTLFPAARLNIDFFNRHLRVTSGSGVRIIGGARID